MAEPTFPVRVFAMQYEAEGVLSFILRMPDGGYLPAVDPGSHVDIVLPNRMMRSYSLSNGPQDGGSYRLTVARDANSTGGSRYLHETLRVGQIVQISQPRNNFKLADEAPLSVFIAGGIGITPFVPMAARLNDRGRPWRLHYCVRTRARASLLGDLVSLMRDGSGELILNFDEEPGGTMLDLASVLGELPRDAHVYCCGPSGMLDAFRAAAAAAGIEDNRAHFEYFSADVVSATEGGFTVVCQKSGRDIVVRPGETILAAILADGIDIPYSCEDGVCGSCEVRVLSGTPDHRDMILSDSEKAANRTMMVCCSGSKSARLVLDI